MRNRSASKRSKSMKVMAVSLPLFVWIKAKMSCSYLKLRDWHFKRASWSTSSKHHPIRTPLSLPSCCSKPLNGEAFEIGDIQYASNSAEIDRTSIIILEAFASYLTRNEALGVHNYWSHPMMSALKVKTKYSPSVVHWPLPPLLPTMEFLWRASPRKDLENPIPSHPILMRQSRSINRRTEFEITLKN